MDFDLLLQRVAEALPALDQADPGGRVSRRTKKPYLPGLASMSELEVTLGIKDWWDKNHPEDLRGGSLETEVPYPNNTSTSRCDLVIHDGAGKTKWHIELKQIEFFGDNGKNNDYGVAKAISPFLKDRSLLHDARRLRHSGFSGNGVVLAYGFTYSPDSVAEAFRRFNGVFDNQNPPEPISVRIRELDKIRARATEDGVNGVYSIKPIVEIVDRVLLGEQSILEPAQIVQFSGAWRHPCGGDGLLAGWKVPLLS